MRKLITLIAIVLLATGCQGGDNKPLPAADQPGMYKKLVEGKKVGIVANQTSMAGDEHLVEYLLGQGINIKVIFTPEHGYRELAADGEHIGDGTDVATGIPIRSLYGVRRKPAPEDMAGIDIVIYDIQDVGARFYTYISTLHYVMEACAENKVKCIVFDRPNPNGFYFDGNIADTAYRSFVGMHPVPVMHGMTVGEYAKMINGEGWLPGGIQCDLTVVKCKNYTHQSFYELPVRPSPNLPNMTAIYLYPSLCFFEGTNVSLGRGTPFPFQVYGSPLFPDEGFSFTPESLPESVKPPLLGKKCYGVDLRNAVKDKLVPAPEINLEWVIDAYDKYPEKDKFFNNYFDVLAAGPVLREQIIKGMSSEEIRATWKEGLEKYGRIRDKYLLYDK
jgi:uncharacterized protein YbbC (DUF1343 family)